MAGRAESDRPGLVPGRGRLPSLESAGRRPDPASRRVVHGLHAVPARGQPGHAPEHLRVRVADRRTRRSRCRVGLALRRGRRDRRGGPDDVPSDAARAGPGQPRGPSALSPDPADVFRGRSRTRRDPARDRGSRGGNDRSRRARTDAGRAGSAGRGRRRRPARLPGAARTDARHRGACPRGRRPVRGGRRTRLAGRPGATRGVRRRHRRRRGSAARDRAPVRRPVPGHPRLDRRPGPADPRPPGRDDHRSRRPTRLRHDDAGARAGHPPGQGRQQHLHEPGPARAGRLGLPRDDRAARPARCRDPRGRPRRRARAGARGGRGPAAPPRSVPQRVRDPRPECTGGPSSAPGARHPRRPRARRRDPRRSVARRWPARVRHGGDDLGRDRPVRERPSRGDARPTRGRRGGRGRRAGYVDAATASSRR